MKTRVPTLRAVQKAIKVILADAAVMSASKGRGVSEQQYLREIIDFANTGRMPNALAGPPNQEYLDAKIMDGVRRLLRADLQALVDGCLTAADKKRLYATADRVLLIPRTGDDGTVVYRYVTENFEAAIAHAMRLLLANPEDQEDLRQCRWKDCNRFFFVSQRLEAAAAPGKTVVGKRPDRYCCKEHMRAAHRVRATEATIARRKKLREQKLQATARAAAKHK